MSASNATSSSPGGTDITFTTLQNAIRQRLAQHSALSMTAWSAITILGISILLACTTSSDLAVVSIIIVVRRWTQCRSLISSVIPNICYLYLALTIAVQAWYASASSTTQDDSGGTRPPADNDPPFQPMIFPCRTTHSRLFPIKHSFSYSYLFVGVPADWNGAAGSILSGDGGQTTSDRAKTWFSIRAEDYLERGHHPGGLKGKLRDYLISQHVKPDEYPYAYLVTAPRFLGWSFNPVSFWYLYNKHKRLGAMILEVNNTFDERRMYLMRQEKSLVDDHVLSDKVDTLHGPKFTYSWSKDFHVSPFNDRRGSYILEAQDPFLRAPAVSTNQIHNQILLKSEDRIKLNTRVFSTEPGIPSSSMTTLSTIRFIAGWWWVGFMTNPRILKEARVLWVKKLQVFYRPEVVRTSIGRNELDEEVVLEGFWRGLLQDVSDVLGVVVDYTAAAGSQRGKTQEIMPKVRQGDNGKSLQKRIDVKVLTPAFYSELVTTTNVMNCMDKVCFEAAEGEAMVYTSSPGILRQMFAGYVISSTTRTDQLPDTQSSGIPSRTRKHTQQVIDLLRSDEPLWRIFPMLLVHLVYVNFLVHDSGEPATISARATSASTVPKSGITLESLIFKSFTSSASQLDSFSDPNPALKDIKKYDRAVMTILLSNRLALGFPGLLKFYFRIIHWIELILLSILADSVLGLFHLGSSSSIDGDDSGSRTSMTEGRSNGGYKMGRSILIIGIIGALKVLGRTRKVFDVKGS